MNREDIIKLAREAGGEDWGIFRDFMPELEHFAALVAAAEREKVAVWMVKHGYATGHGDTIQDLLAELGRQIAENWNRAMIKGIETEREACAKVCDKLGDEFGDANPADCAAAIRERGLAQLNAAAEANGEEL